MSNNLDTIYFVENFSAKMDEIENLGREIMMVTTNENHDFHPLERRLEAAQATLNFMVDHKSAFGDHGDSYIQKMGCRIIEAYNNVAFFKKYAKDRQLRETFARKIMDI